MCFSRTQTMKSEYHRHCPAIFAMACLCLLAGCQSSQQFARKVGLAEQPKRPGNFYLDEETIVEVERVALLPVHAPAAGLANEAEIDTQFLSKLTATQLFEVVSLSREDLARRFGQRSFSSAGILNQSLFDYIQATTAADAVVLFDITSYHPFQPIRVGVRGKLITLQDQQVLWAVDELFDAGAQHISRDAEVYEKRHMAQFPTSKQHDSILMSPSRFIAYAAERCILTLPPNSLNDNF